MESESVVRDARITGAQFILAVQDGMASAAWYRDVLGFELRESPDGTGAGWHVLERGGFRIWLGEASGPFVPMSECQDHSWFAYAFVENIDAFYEEVTARGAELWHRIADKPWGMREFAVVTPDGHRIVFGEDLKGEE